MIVEPAQTDTDMWRGADEDLNQTVASISAEHRDLYRKHIDGFRKSIPRSQRMAAPVDGVAATIERALTARRPRARYVVGAGARVQAAMAKAHPDPGPRLRSAGRDRGPAPPVGQARRQAPPAHPRTR